MTSGETLINVESNGIGIMPLATLLSSYWRAYPGMERHFTLHQWEIHTTPVGELTMAKKRTSSIVGT
jgi:hypothetical protein